MLAQAVIPETVLLLVLAVRLVTLMGAGTTIQRMLVVIDVEDTPPVKEIQTRQIPQPLQQRFSASIPLNNRGERQRLAPPAANLARSGSNPITVN